MRNMKTVLLLESAPGPLHGILPPPAPCIEVTSQTLIRRSYETYLQAYNRTQYLGCSLLSAVSSRRVLGQMDFARFSTEEAESNIQKFVDIVRFPTVSALGPSNGAYDECVSYLMKICTEAGLSDVRILQESLPGKPILLASWIGKDPGLPQLLLNSHYDVVPVQEENWTVPAFEGLRKDGKVYGRGTQDMKCVCVQYVIAIETLKKKGFVPERTVHLSFVPDEEIGGVGYQYKSCP